MDYKFLDREFINDDIILPDSDRINHFLLKNHYADAVKALDFFATDGKLLYIHGFLGTGKRQFINYISGFFTNEIIKLEYHCKVSTVCDDILINFIDIIEKNSMAKAITQTSKISTLAVRFKQYISSIKKPFVIILHSFDDIQDENIKLISECIASVAECANVKIIISTRAMLQGVIEDVKIDRKIFLKAFSREIFQDFCESYQITGSPIAFDDFYKYTRGYYYYTALAIKIIQAMKSSLNDFLSKYTMSGMTFDSFLGATYINLIPNTIRNFFWFLRTIRHGISLNALAVLELYDEFSINYLKTNLMIYQSEDCIYVQDYFQQDIDISIPAKTEIKLHKYIITIYEKELKESLQSRDILLSRQALRSEIEYHNNCIKELEDTRKGVDRTKVLEIPQAPKENENINKEEELHDINVKMQDAKKLADKQKYSEAIKAYNKIIEEMNVNPNTLAEIRVELARLHKIQNEYPISQHYYESAEAYYKHNEEWINLNYLYYELSELYSLMYKNERAIETLQKVIYSTDTPQTLMVESCIRLGNLYTEQDKPKEAYKFYQKALESADDNIPDSKLAELFFKYALACDEQDDSQTAFDYYNKCIQIQDGNQYKALAYSNMGACYYDNENLSDAENCFLKAYDIEKTQNNYEGIYYTASYLAKIYAKTNIKKAYNYMMEAKQSAEFINEDFYILEATVTLGDYYYDYKNLNKKALIEYLTARRIAQNFDTLVDIKKIEERIQDMKLRMNPKEYKEIEERYG